MSDIVMWYQDVFDVSLSRLSLWSARRVLLDSQVRILHNSLIWGGGGRLRMKNCSELVYIIYYILYIVDVYRHLKVKENKGFIVLSSEFWVVEWCSKSKNWDYHPPTTFQQFSHSKYYLLNDIYNKPILTFNIEL